MVYPNERIADRVQDLSEAVKEKKHGSVLLLMDEIYSYSQRHPRKWAATLRARFSEKEQKAIMEALKLYKESGL